MGKNLRISLLARTCHRARSDRSAGSFSWEPENVSARKPHPAADGSFTPLNGIPLSEAEVGETVQVLAVNATATDVIKYLYERGLLPGRTVNCCRCRTASRSAHVAGGMGKKLCWGYPWLSL